MSTARKYNSNQRSMSPESRRKAYGKINIVWEQLRPDLKWEDKDEKRQQLLDWIIRFLDLKKLDSIKDLSDGQLGLVIEEMMRLSGNIAQPTGNVVKARKDNVVKVDFASRKLTATPTQEIAGVIHFATEPQTITLGKLSDYIWGDDTERRNNFLTKRKFSTNFKMLQFDKATALTIILLNIAADKDLRAKGEKKVTRAMTSKHIPTLKKKLRINN